MPSLAGPWKYQSYRPEPVSAMATPAAPLLKPWAPVTGHVTIDPGETSGTLVFPGVPLPPLALTIQVAPGTPRKISISASATVAGAPFANELVGWEVPADLLNSANGEVVIRGAIVQTTDSPGGGPPPVFTTGFFVLQR